MPLRILLILTLTASALTSGAHAAPPEAYFGPDISSGNTVDSRIEGGVRIVRLDTVTFGLEAAVESALNFSELRAGYLGAVYRQSFSDAFEITAGLGGRITSINPFKSGVYLRAGAVFNFEPIHIKPWFQYAVNAQEGRFGVTLEYQVPAPQSAPQSSPLDDSWNF